MICHQCIDEVGDEMATIQEYLIEKEADERGNTIQLISRNSNT
jgi:hypothetical protein